MTAMLAAVFAMPASAATQVEVTGNPVMIRADAGLKNTVVSKAHKGDRYAYVGQKKDSTGRVWYNIKYSGNKTGWITSQFARKTETAAEQPATTKQVQITATPVNVRSGAGTNYKKLGKTTKGKTYAYLASKKDSSGRVWYQIQYTAKTKGWVMGSLSKLVGETATANPVKAYEGTYQCDRATITVKASGKSDAKMTVTWGSSAWENSVWEMSGMFDSSVYRVDYGNGIRTDYAYNDNGSVSSKRVAYKNSTGRIQFNDTKTLVWRDENEPEHGEMTFTKISSTVTEPEQPASAAKKVQITASPVNVRSGAGTNYKKLGKTSKGKTYTYLASKKDSSGRVWYQIQYTSKTKGWVMGSLAKLVGGNQQPAVTDKQVQITATPVNVRSGAGTNYKKLGKTSKGKTYAYLASKKDSSGRVWYQIQYTSQTKGWVMGSLAKLENKTSDTFMKGIFENIMSDSQYKEWKKMNPEAKITEKLSGSTITFTVTGGLNIDGMDDEDFTNDKPVIAGKYVFKHNGDYVVYTSQDAKHLSNSFNPYILIAICDYYGMSFVTANEYIAAHPDNTYYVVNTKNNTIKMYAAAKWNMK